MYCRYWYPPENYKLWIILEWQGSYLKLSSCLRDNLTPLTWLNQWQDHIRLSLCRPCPIIPSNWSNMVSGPHYTGSKCLLPIFFQSPGISRSSNFLTEDSGNSSPDYEQEVIDKWREYITLKSMPLSSLGLHSYSCLDWAPTKSGISDKYILPIILFRLPWWGMFTLTSHIILSLKLAKIELIWL